MTDEKSSFVLYAEYLEHIKLLTMEQRGALLTAVLCYASGDELPEMDGMTNMAFSFIKSRIDRDTAAYLEKIEKRREAGKLGGRPKTKDISQKQEKAKKANGFSEKQNNPVNPMWYVGGDNKNGESKLAGKAAFNSDYNFNLYEYFHFCSKMLKKEPKEKGKAPCMIVFCSFQQIPTMLKAAEKHGFRNSIHLTFVKNYSAQVLKANMRVVGATEHALVLHKGLPESDKAIWLGTEHGLIFYRDKLPKFNNDGKMIFDWMPWEKDPKGKYPNIHPTQKPVRLLKKLIKIFTDEGDVVIDPCCGSGSTLRAAMELGRPSYGFEIDRNFYERAKNEMLVENYGEVSMRAEDSVTGQRNIFDMLEVLS